MLGRCRQYGDPRLLEVTEERNGPSGLRDDDDDGRPIEPSLYIGLLGLFSTGQQTVINWSAGLKLYKIIQQWFLHALSGVYPTPWWAPQRFNYICCDGHPQTQTSNRHTSAGFIPPYDVSPARIYLSMNMQNSNWFYFSLQVQQSSHSRDPSAIWPTHSLTHWCSGVHLLGEQEYFVTYLHTKCNRIQTLWHTIRPVLCRAEAHSFVQFVLRPTGSWMWTICYRQSFHSFVILEERKAQIEQLGVLL